MEKIFAKNSRGKDYDCKYNWPKDCYIQCGAKGIVIGEKGISQTAFFEAFPKNPDTFIRGEGKTIEEAEKNAWEQLENYKSCKEHKFERRGYTNGAGFCKYCGLFKSHAFAPSTKCCICGIPTDWVKDNKDNWYCENHEKNIPIKNIKPLMLNTFISNYRKKIENIQDIDKIICMMNEYNNYYINKYNDLNYSEDDFKKFFDIKKFLSQNNKYNYDCIFAVENMKMDTILLIKDNEINILNFDNIIIDNTNYYLVLLNNNQHKNILLFVEGNKLKEQNIDNIEEYLKKQIKQFETIQAKKETFKVSFLSF